MSSEFVIFRVYRPTGGRVGMSSTSEWLMLGDWTKQEAERARESAGEMWEAISRKKQLDFLGHLNEILVFIEEAKKHAPEEPSE